MLIYLSFVPGTTCLLSYIYAAVQAQHLTRVHHKNLVSLIGYCKDKDHFALVYEYMPEGNLQDHLRLRGCLILAHSNIKPTGCVLDQILTVFLFFFFYFRLGVQFLLMCLDTCTHRPLTWQQRLQIALDAAQGTRMNELPRF